MKLCQATVIGSVVVEKYLLVVLWRVTKGREGDSPKLHIIKNLQYFNSFTVKLFLAS